MKVEELLVVVSDSTVVRLVDTETGNVLDVYDGRNSIDSRYNSCEIEKISLGEKSLDISVCIEQW